MDTYPKHLVFAAIYTAGLPITDEGDGGGLFLAFQYGGEGEMELICSVTSGMTFRDLIEKVDEWEDR